MGYVETHDLHKHFGEVRAVDGVNLDVAEGELLVLLGPSGCGKTTLMRMIAGLETPTSGRIVIGGEEVDEDVPPRARGVAMVFQSYALYPHKTAFGNIAFPLEALGLAQAQIAEKVDAGARMFGIGHLLRRLPRQLSGGERQRVALARAVVRDPRVFLFDEPLSNLDAQLRAIARYELKEFQRQIGTTTIYVTHDQVEAMGLGDRIAVMDRGKVRQIGTPQEVYDYPADTFVATFLGSPPMNLVEHDSETLLGFRPEHFLPREVFPSEEPVVTFHLRVRQIEHLGADRLLYGTLEEQARRDQTVIAALPVTIRTPIQEGEVYRFAVPQRALRTFDRATGRARDGAR
ncbi:MAG: ABC transporter ATP-binding protein [Armatimonadota bacterium]|nr:ABC transporter ATP-binding protein [Armatimonadota bacterium]MDR7448006.1 ABC transporter ATP-binding protein [Armatimonadota bacterium]MDR7459739.1 ABC transporter ATP-binding protein [Armatimonadota bacterium]MDR7478602.1 ABC transporter ATP-binding protein [Armatimonadota bacterium]MDR7488420.1 ABC transporter ATP-binding protein [Armatimonadota bacterium]